MVASAERKKERDRLVRKARKLLKELSAFAKNNKSTKTNLTKKIPFAGAKHSPVFVRYLDAKHAGVVRSYRTRFREIDRELAEVGYAGKTKPKRLTPGILLFPIKLTVTKYGKTHASYKYTVTFMSNDVPKTLNRPLPPVFYVVQPRKGFSIAYRDANRATLT